MERRLLNLSMGQCSGAAALVTADRLGLGAFSRAESVVAGYEQLAHLDAELAEVQRAIDGCVLTWAERGGPPVVPSARSGFGRSLLEEMPRHDLGAEVRLDFRAKGLAYALAAPLGVVAA